MLKGLPVEIITANNGQQTMNKIVEERPDIVLLDLLMPKTDGYTVLQKVRRGECGLSNIPIVVLSALSGSSIEKAISLGANSYIQKPFDMNLLRNTVKENLHIAV